MTHCDPSPLTLFLTHTNLLIVFILGKINDLFHYLFIGPINKTNFERFPDEATKKPYTDPTDDFFIRRIYGRCSDCFHRPISSRPSSFIDVMMREEKSERVANIETNGQVKKCLNLASYNYLGFSQSPAHVVDQVLESFDKYGVASCSAYADYGYTPVHRDLEKRVSRFIGKESAMVVSMGFATNSTVIPLLAPTRDCLVLSDSLNHSSIVNGIRASEGGPTIHRFRHNDMDHLEKLLRAGILDGQPGTRKPWKKIIVIVEGIYSMEGEIVNLKRVVELKKQYKFYLYVDEAHSCGALGKSGRGVCEQAGVDPKDVDILMGTFTKSFNSVGGYISGDAETINFLKKSCFGLIYGSSMSVPCAQQALSALTVIMGEDNTKIGIEKLEQLNFNTNYFGDSLKKRGFEIISDRDSPVIVMMIYHLTKLIAFSRMCLERGIAIVIVGAPACPTALARVRFCISSAHTKKDLDEALATLENIGNDTMTRYKLHDSHLINEFVQLVL